MKGPDQFEMFDGVVETRGRNRRVKAYQVEASMDDAEMVRRLMATGRYRILSKLSPRPVVADPRPGFPRVGVIVDTETTGLNFRTHEVIEFGAVVFSFSDTGQVGDVLEVYGGLQQPTSPISEEITKLTGITDAMVSGQALEVGVIERLLHGADLIIAHNARFDRPFCERISPRFADLPWACSNSEIGWSARGFEGSKLGYLVAQSGFFHDGHRAVDDCFALLEVLSVGGDQSGASPFYELYQASQQSRARIWALNSPFEAKDVLKGRGYKWSDGSDGQPKSWWTEVVEAELDTELTFLRTEIYHRSDAEPLVRLMSAVDRFKA